MIAAGTRPPRVTATMPCHGPSSMRRQASALAWRCNSSQLTGNVLACDVMVAFIAGNTSRRALLTRRQETAVDLPAAVGLALHDVKREGGLAVGSDELDSLDDIAVHSRDGAELDIARPINRLVAGAHHAHEIVRRAELLLDRRRTEAQPPPPLLPPADPHLPPHSPPTPPP